MSLDVGLKNVWVYVRHGPLSQPAVSIQISCDCPQFKKGLALIRCLWIRLEPSKLNVILLFWHELQSATSTDDANVFNNP